MKEKLMDRSITLRELTNYASAACWQGYAEGSVAPDGDWSPTAQKWQKMQEAAEIVIRDFFFAGDDRAATRCISENGDYIRLNCFIGDPDIFKDHPEIYDEMSEENREVLDGTPDCCGEETTIPFD